MACDRTIRADDVVDALRESSRSPLVSVYESVLEDIRPLLLERRIDHVADYSPGQLVLGRVMQPGDAEDFQSLRYLGKVLAYTNIPAISPHDLRCELEKAYYANGLRRFVELPMEQRIEQSSAREPSAFERAINSAGLCKIDRKLTLHDGKPYMMYTVREVPYGAKRPS